MFVASGVRKYIFDKLYILVFLTICQLLRTEAIDKDNSVQNINACIIYDSFRFAATLKAKSLSPFATNEITTSKITLGTFFKWQP
jgi:hypothetical protein